jgi:hypothetical protein
MLHTARDYVGRGKKRKHALLKQKVGRHGKEKSEKREKKDEEEAT